jgi:hypothetical protein
MSLILRTNLKHTSIYIALAQGAFRSRPPSRAGPQRLMDVDEVVPERIQRDHVRVISSCLLNAFVSPAARPSGSA